MRISPEVDEMMWGIANTGDFQAVENFRKQFPDFHDELSKRVLLVKDLKRARTLQVSAIPRPAFIPKTRIRPRFSWPLIGSVVFSATAIAGAMAYKVNGPHAAPPPVICRVGVAVPQKEASTTPGLAPVTLPEVKVVTGRSLPIQDGMLPTRKPGERLSVQELGGPLQPSSTDLPHMLVPVKVKGNTDARNDNGAMEETHIVFKQTPLDTVIKAIASSFKTEIKSAPGMPNTTIDVDEHAKTPREVLERLGHKYGFGVLDDGTYLLLLPTSSSNNSQPNP